MQRNSNGKNNQYNKINNGKSLDYVLFFIGIIKYTFCPDCKFNQGRNE